MTNSNKWSWRKTFNGLCLYVQIVEAIGLVKTRILKVRIIIIIIVTIIKAMTNFSDFL